MFEGQPIDGVTHIFCMRLAYRLAGIIEPLCRPEEISEVARAFYSAIRDDLKRYEEGKVKRA